MQGMTCSCFESTRLAYELKLRGTQKERKYKSEAIRESEMSSETGDFCAACLGYSLSTGLRRLDIVNIVVHRHMFDLIPHGLIVMKFHQIVKWSGSPLLFNMVPNTLQ